MSDLESYQKRLRAARNEELDAALRESTPEEIRRAVGRELVKALAGQGSDEWSLVDAAACALHEQRQREGSER